MTLLIIGEARALAAFLRGVRDDSRPGPATAFGG
jgi:hypothetical protein